MKTLGSLLLLFWSGLLVVAAEPGEVRDEKEASSQQSCDIDIKTVLKEISTLVAEHRDGLIQQLEAMRKQVETMDTKLKAFEEKDEATRADIKELQERSDKSKVSFSASLVATGDTHTGPFSTDTTLVFKHIFTNIGGAYNPHTGVFTAPVKGVYHFDVHVFGDSSPGRVTAAQLFKNGDPIIYTFGHVTGYHAASSNGVSLLMEVGDVVYLKLRANAWVRDNRDHHTTFSGHMLFSM